MGHVLRVGDKQKLWTLPQIVDRMRTAYCGTLAVELTHLATRLAHTLHCHHTSLLTLQAVRAGWLFSCCRPSRAANTRLLCLCMTCRLFACITVTTHIRHRLVAPRHACSEQKDWMIERMENRQQASEQQRLSILRGLIDADAFERFLASKFPASKVQAQICWSRLCSNGLCGQPSLLCSSWVVVATSLHNVATVL